MGSMSPQDSLPTTNLCGELLTPTTPCNLIRSFINSELIQIFTVTTSTFTSLFFFFFFSVVTVSLLLLHAEITLWLGDKDFHCDSVSVVSACSSVRRVKAYLWLKGIFQGMAQGEVDDLVVHLEESIELMHMESGIRLIEAILAKKTLNMWGIRNVLRSS